MYQCVLEHRDPMACLHQSTVLANSFTFPAKTGRDQRGAISAKVFCTPGECVIPTYVTSAALFEATE